MNAILSGSCSFHERSVSQLICANDDWASGNLADGMVAKQKSLDAGDGLEPSITLGMLSAVEQSSDVTQRKLARELGIALGLANAYLKRLVKKGYIKATQAPANRYAYYLTPQGFAEKSALTAEYLSQSFKFFRAAREQSSDALQTCSANNWSRVVLCGTGDLAEIAVLSAQEFDIKLVCVVDPQFNHTSFLELPVVASIEAAGDFDGVIITDTRRPQDTFEKVCSQIDATRVITLPLLGITAAAAKRGLT